MTTDNIKKICVVIETDDGKTRHLITDKKNTQSILMAIGAIEGKMRITEPIDSIEFVTQKG